MKTLEGYFWRTPRKHVLAWSLGSFVAAFSFSAESQSRLPELLKALNLSSYSHTMRPPAFTARTPEGQTVSLADLRGKVLLLNFWASWCLECRPEMPLFEQLHREFAAQGLSVVAINAREGTVAIRNYAKELDLKFPLLVDSNGEVGRAYGVIGLPTTFLIGRDGRAVALAVGPRDWASAPGRALIQALLAEPATLGR
jgi:peroxiredoxin